jgi:hypothetical protein
MAGVEFKSASIRVEHWNGSFEHSSRSNWDLNCSKEQNLFFSNIEILN